MKYKIGDKVVVKRLSDIVNVRDIGYNWIPSMGMFCGKTYVVDRVVITGYGNEIYLKGTNCIFHESWLYPYNEVTLPDDLFKVE